MSFLTHLECSRTGDRYDADQLHNLSEVGAPLLARYDLDAVNASVKEQGGFAGRRPDMWRYREVLPLRSLDGEGESEIVSLGEGFTPLRSSPNLGAVLGLKRLSIKDESLNPTGSFKARGLSAAVTGALARGARKLAIPTAGNAGGALAAYAAAAGLEAFVFMPADTPVAFQIECRSCGAHLELVDGLINDCGAIVGERKQEEGWFDVSTLKEPYRVEGKKTMGYELFEQLDGELPDVILYPTGGGTGLIGMWKAFDEMEQMGWIDSRRPRMISVQSVGCAPIARALEEGTEDARPWENAQTRASGLRVPVAVADFLMLRAIRETGGCAVTVSDEELVDATHEMARHTGIFAAPEGGATFAALRKLLESDDVQADERIVLFNTGSGYKYLELLADPPV